MFRFEHIAHLYALGILPILIAFFVWTLLARRKAWSAFGSLRTRKFTMPWSSRYKHTLKFVLLMISLLFLIIGWANPQWGSKKEKINRKSLDIFIALDISQSMLAEDIAPSRLDRAIKFTQNLVEGLKTERIGFIIFAGNAYLQVPLTTDYAAVQLFVKSANPEMAPSQGTAIVDAIDLAERSFEEENKSHKALVIITDGENHDDEAMERAKKARENGLLIFTVGVGTEAGSFIPTIVAGRADYKRDRSGNPVRSKLNEEMLRGLAKEGTGAYLNLMSGSEDVVDALSDRIDMLEKRELETRTFTDYESYFQYFLIIALFLLIAEFLISYRKSKSLAGRDIFKVS